MRIVLDLQGAQTESRFRGIGRYSLALAQALCSVAANHDLWLVLNGCFSDTIDPIRKAFDGLISQAQIRVFDVPGPVAETESANEWRARAAEKIRECFLADLEPDMVHVSSLFEGWLDNGVTSIGQLETTLATSTTFYDAIPFLNQDSSSVDSRYRAYYLRKAQSLKRARLLLAISESSRREAIDCFSIREDCVVTIGAGVDNRFKPAASSGEEIQALLNRYDISPPYILYSGGFDRRKNVETLIRAFSLLPEEMFASYQLVLVGGLSWDRSLALQHLIRQLALESRQVLFPGFVSDQDLVGLYCSCDLFVFPSLHEGFGLPPIEAMSCGAPTIGSDRSSIPEVIDRRDALFDPTSPYAVAAKMHQVLSDMSFREQLRTYGINRGRLFTWESVARKALQALETAHNRKQDEARFYAPVGKKVPSLAYVSPLPPEPSGISDYSAELLPELAHHYDITLIVNQNQVIDPWLTANFPVRDVNWFNAHGRMFDRILYHFGNSKFHSHMFDLLERYSGTVVLHDFFLSGVLNWMEQYGLGQQFFRRALYESHGFAGLSEEACRGREASVLEFPCNFQVVSHAMGVIVHSQHSIALAGKWYGCTVEKEFCHIPHLRKTAGTVDRDLARARLGLSTEDWLVCSFGVLDTTKLSHRIVDEWLNSTMANDPQCRLVFVGKHLGGEYGYNLLRTIESSGLKNRIRITGFAPPELFRDYLAAADVAVQLRTLSRGETSGTILDCLARGVPTIINAHGSAAEIPDDVVIKLDDVFPEKALATQFDILRNDSALRASLSRRALEYVRRVHDPYSIAVRYRDAIEHFRKYTRRSRYEDLIGALATTNTSVAPNECDFVSTACAITSNQPQFGALRLLVDVSLVARDDLRTGIQRVVRGILSVMLRTPPDGYRVEPICHNDSGGYYYARGLVHSWLSLTGETLEDTPVQPRPGDIYLGLDWNPDAVVRLKPLFEQWRDRGVGICFVVHDILPVRRPDWFPDSMNRVFQDWLRTIASVSDRILCVSRATADDILEWLDRTQPLRRNDLEVGVFHNGAGIQAAFPVTGTDRETEELLQAIKMRPAFLLVGTVEPRKGHTQVLAAFEQFWSAGLDVNLVIVGKRGWMIETLTDRLSMHPEKARRLFWLQGISDEMLERLYESSTALIAASEGEGFGLPLIEAAQHKLQIIARDIPVFREVAGDYAFYFDGIQPEDLAKAIQEWMSLKAQGQAPSSEGMPRLTWKESADQLVNALLKGDLYRSWSPRQSIPGEGD